MKKIKTKAGFSLIELMVVLVIIGLLISFALPNFQKTNQRADLMAVKTALGITHLKVSRCYFNQLEKYWDDQGNPLEQCNYDYAKIEENQDLQKYLIAEEYQTNAKDEVQAEYQIDIEVKNRPNANINDKKTFEVVATLRDNQSDSNCYKLAIDEQGKKTSQKSNGNDTTEQGGCWH